MFNSKLFIIVVTFCLALLLNLLPFPSWVGWLRPNWVFILLIYWVWIAPQWVGLGCAFFLGLLLDLQNGTVLGEHAIAILPFVYLTIKFHKQLHMFPGLQQMFIILFYSLGYKLIIFSIQAFVGAMPYNMLFWLAALVNMLLWPLLLIVMRDVSQKFYMDR